MNAVLDFIKAAAPWIAAGLAVVILTIRGVAGKKKGEQMESNYGTEGMSLGMCFGLLIGTMFENSTGIGISVGMLAGLAVGICIPKKQGRGG